MARVAAGYERTAPETLGRVKRLVRVCSEGRFAALAGQVFVRTSLFN